MADTLRIKRRAVGGAAGAPATLAAAEIAYNEVDDTLYYGKGNSGGAATAIVAIAGTGAFQPKDADLTSLAAASAVGVLYYRSAADTWGPVTIGTGLSFTSGTLANTGAPVAAEYVTSTADAALTNERVLTDSASITWDRTVAGQIKANSSAGGGNVSNSGTPVSGQWARWTTANTIEGVAAASTGFMQKTGDTMSGDLAIDKATPKLAFNKVNSTTPTEIVAQTAGVANWTVRLGSITAASFEIGLHNFSTGAQIDIPLSINTSAQATFSVTPVFPTAAATDNSTKGATTAYVRSVVRDASAVRGLVGSGSGATAFMAYHECLMHDSAGVGVLVKNVGATSIATGTTGANGRDAVLADGDVSFYSMWGATPGVAFICSNANPPTGPALPSGYTHWAYLTTIKRTGGSLYTVAVRGNKVFYATWAAITGGANFGDGIWGSFSVAAYVPAIATNFSFTANGTAGTGGGGAAGLAYQIGWQNTVIYSARLDCSYANMNMNASIHGWLPNVNQTLWQVYISIYNVGNFISNGMAIYINGYEVPNDS
jgi:hypothetical protein